MLSARTNCPSWGSEDIPWHCFRPNLVEPDLVRLIAAVSLIEHNSGAYARYLQSVFSGDAAFCSALSLWVREEVQHGEVLRRWTALADPDFDGDAALARFAATITLPEEAAESVRGSRLGELVARCTVEVGTHTFYSAIAEAAREPVLREICRRIAADEARHYRLFLTHAKRYREQAGRCRMLAVALSRIADTGDDELAYAWRSGAGDGPYRRRRDAASFHLAALGRYRPRHIERAAKLLAQAAGFASDGWIARLGGLVGWRALARRVRAAARTVPGQSLIPG